MHNVYHCGSKCGLNLIKMAFLILENRSVEVFVSNKTEIRITDPDVRGGDTVEYDLGKSSSRIEATCTAYGGSPTPTFKW